MPGSAYARPHPRVSRHVPFPVPLRSPLAPPPVPGPVTVHVCISTKGASVASDLTIPFRVLPVSVSPAPLAAAVRTHALLITWRRGSHQARRDLASAEDKGSLFDFTVVNDQLPDAYAALKVHPSLPLPPLAPILSPSFPYRDLSPSVTLPSSSLLPSARLFHSVVLPLPLNLHRTHVWFASICRRCCASTPTCAS